MSQASVLQSVIQPKPPAQPPTVRPLVKGAALLDDEVIGNDPEDLDALLGVLVENAPVAMAMFDRHMHYLLANRQWIVDFGLQDAVPLVGRSQFEVFPHLHSGWRSVYDRALQGHVVRSEHDVTQGPDGETMIFRWEVRPWRRRRDADVGGVMVTCEKFTPVGLPSEASVETNAPTPPIATADAKPPSMVDSLLKSDLPILLIDLDGVIQHSNDAATRLSLSRGIRAGVSHFWEVFGTEQDAPRLRQQTIEAVAQVLGSDGEVATSLTVCDPQRQPGKVFTWALSRMDGEERELGVMMIGVACDLPEPPPAPVAPPAVNLHSSTVALEAAFQMEKRQLEEQIAAANQEMRLLQNIEQAYKRRELRQREVLDTMPCGLIVLDERGRPTFQNAHVRDLFGRELKAGDSVEDWLLLACVNDSQREEVATIWRESVWRRQLTRVVSLSTADGLLKDFEFRPSPLPSHGLLVTIHDVTESCRLEEMLRSTEAKFRSLLHDAPGAILLTDPAGTIFEANGAAEKLLGKPKSELRRTSVDDWFDHEGVLTRRAELRHLANGGAPRAVVEVRLKDRESKLLLRLAGISDAEHRLHSVVHFLDDVKSSPVIEGSEMPPLVSVVPESLPPVESEAVVVLRATSQGRITEWSATAEGLFGWSAADASKKSLHQLFRPSDATGFYFDLRQVLDAENHPGVEWTCFGAEGRRGSHQFQVRELAPHGEIELLVVQRASEPVRGTAVAPSQGRWPLADLDRERLLLTETHHRIQNHLQLISSLLNLQSNSLDQESVRHALRSSQNRVRAIAALHQHLYQMALGQNVPFDQFVEGVVARLRDCYQVPESQVKVATELEALKLLEEWVMPVALIINEAVSNCFKHAFADGRSGNLQICLRREGEKVRLRVQDDGVGLPAGFELERDDGLGFKVIGVFADQMGGQFSVENIASSGVAFDLQFPITCVDI